MATSIFQEKKFKKNQTNTQQLVLRHNAYDRSLFADGAVKAARFMAEQKAGLYTMRDMFKS